MFGYVLPVKCEMKVRDFETYRALYCGVCKQLHKSYGIFSRFLLNYDLVLLAVLRDALAEDSGEMRHEGCFINPLAKRSTCHHTDGLVLASDGLVMLSYHKLRDNIADERLVKRFFYRLARPFFRRMNNKASKNRPGLSDILETEMQRQLALEKAGCDSIDEACEPTAKMCEALFWQAGRNDSERRILSRMGLFAGQIVYLLDAAEDYDDDITHGSYNVFIKVGYTKQQAVEAAQRRCRMAAGEIALAYNLLNITLYKDILDNIFFLGLPAGIAQAGVKRSKRRTGHGQIESV